MRFYTIDVSMLLHFAWLAADLHSNRKKAYHKITKQKLKMDRFLNFHVLTSVHPMQEEVISKWWWWLNQPATQLSSAETIVITDFRWCMCRTASGSISNVLDQLRWKLKGALPVDPSSLSQSFWNSQSLNAKFFVNNSLYNAVRMLRWSVWHGKRSVSSSI